MKYDRLLVLILILFLLSTESRAQVDSKIVIIQLYEVPRGDTRDPVIVTITPDNNQEIIELEKQKIKIEDAVSDFLKFKKEISKWTEKGYEILSITTGDWRSISRTTAFLMKRE